ADLVLESCDLECESNHQSKAEGGSQQLVVRRGQSFTITLLFAGRGYEEGVDTLALNVETGPCPIETSGTKSRFPVSEALDPSAWSAVVDRQDGPSLSLLIYSPPDARIGRYALTLEASMGDQQTNPTGHLAALPGGSHWNDSVFLEFEDQRKEYVLAQQGLIFQGSLKYIVPTAWNFGQFEADMVDICLQLLDTNPKFHRDQNRDCSRRNNPVYIGRVVSAMVNCNDDQGVLAGRWDNKYEDGVSPMSWQGSVDILRRWRKYGCQPVRFSFGPCLCLAACPCHFLRCLGIPTRVVTNYNSAHDTNSNLVIDRYLDEMGNLQASKDMIWNFHCWVESWMTRPDLTAGCDGWQALDPTPQEKSEGAYCCGPAPVTAIKEGELAMKYDSRFVFAEVNADVVYWLLKKDGSQKKTIHSSLIGKKISTKSVGTDTREDITHNYKYPEGSDQEREVFAKAELQKSSLTEEEQGLSLKIKVSEGMNNGCD
uniref:Protein-glutamine gamma-glutamyltransferase 2 n=1 Tax=Pelodiscus sinensis TaxID=13735 RepID=K7FAI3_PELSI